MATVVGEIGMDKSVSSTDKSAKTISRYLAGGEPPVGVLYGLAEAAGASVSWLVGGRTESLRDLDLEFATLQREEAEARAIDPQTLEVKQLLSLILMSIEANRKQRELQERIESRDGGRRYIAGWMRPTVKPVVSSRDSSVDPSHVPRTQPEHEDGMLQIVDPKALESGALVLLPKLRVEAAAGAGAIADDEEPSEMIAFDAAWLRARQITPHGAHVITARGDSMEPTIRNGDLLIVDRAITMAVDSGIYAVVYNGLVQVKRLFLMRDGGVLISSDNKAVGRDEEIRPHEIDQLHIAGRVMWYGRGI